MTANPTVPVSGPGGSTTFTVRFAPTSVGAITAVLEGGQFAQRALAIRRHLAYPKLRAVDVDVIVVDKELKAMIDNLMDVPGPAFAPEGLLMEVSRQVVAGLWQSQGLPRQQLALDVDLDLPWRLVLRHMRLGFTFINFESLDTDADGLGALPLFCDLATLDEERGRTNKPHILSRGVLRLPVKSALLGNEEQIRVGWIFVQLQQVGPG